MYDKNYSIKESAGYFGSLDGKLYSRIFGCELAFLAKSCEELYAARCAEYFEGITAENLKEHTALYTCLEALARYVSDMLDEHGGEFELDGLSFDENASVDDLLKIITPVGLTFERSSYLSEEECPVAYSIKFSFKPVPDEVMEIALHGDEAVYAGEFRGVSPWNDKLLKKKYNYLRR